MIRQILCSFVIVWFIGLISSATAGDNNDAQTAKTTQDTFGLEAITVTAEKRKENVQQVPTSLSAITDIQIEDAALNSTEDFVHQIPNLVIVKTAKHAGVSFINSRGFSGTAFGGSNGTAFYMDGAYYAGGVDTELLDVERIEVLRGPQGTLYGRNTQAGVINVISKQPGDQWERKASVGYGTNNSQDYRVTVGGPLADELSFRITGRAFLSDGFLKNEYTGNDKLDKREDFNGRATLRWAPNGRFDIKFINEASSYSGSYGGFMPLDDLLDDPKTVNYDYEGFAEQDSNSQVFKLDYTHPSFLLSTITTRRDWKSDEATDLDFSSVDDMVAIYNHESLGFSQEVRLVSNDDDSRLQWLLGTYLFSEDFISDYATSYNQGYPSWGLPPFVNYKYTKTESMGGAIFGQATYSFIDRLDLTLGLRYDYEAKDFTYREHYNLDLSAAGMSGKEIKTDEDFSQWLPKVVVAYRWDEDLLTYVNVAKGYKSGGFNAYATSVAGEPYEQEYSWNYEVGIKSSWWQNRLNINATAFYIEGKDTQITQQLNPGEVSVTNAGETKSQGLEIEMNARLAQTLTVVCGFGLTNARFDKYDDKTYDDTGAVVKTVSYNGNTIPYAPEYTYNLGLTYRHHSGFFARGGLSGVGPFYYDSANTEKASAYELVNARLGYESESFDIYLKGKNLLDTVYANRAFDNGGTQFVGRANDPLSVDVTLVARF